VATPLATHHCFYLSAVTTGLAMCNLILEREDEEEKVRLINSLNNIYMRFSDVAQGEWLKEQRAKRRQDWKDFMDTMCQKSAQVDRETSEERQRVTAYYAHIEEKLFASPPPKSPK
jgi:hypothetical protein